MKDRRLDMTDKTKNEWLVLLDNLFQVLVLELKDTAN